MKEIIDSILQAEEMANQIVQSATEKAQKINAQRDADSEKAKALVSLSFSAERKKAIKQAEAKAQDLYEKEISLANEQALALKQDLSSKQEKIVREIVDGLIK